MAADSPRPAMQMQCADTIFSDFSAMIHGVSNLVIIISYRANGLSKFGLSRCTLEDLDQCSGDPVGILREGG